MMFFEKGEMRKTLNKKGGGGARQATVACNKRRPPCHPPTEPNPTATDKGDQAKTCT